MLHRYVYLCEKGKIPKGYAVHHIDENKENNSADNLRLVPKSKHAAHHTKKRIYSDYETERQKFIERTNEKAKVWHKSAEGIEWHSKHAKESICKASERNQKAKCIVCGKEYMTTKSTIHRAMFCSKKCKAKYRRDNRLDYIECICVICGQKFMADKYGKVKTCSKECKVKLWRQNKYGKE